MADYLASMVGVPQRWQGDRVSKISNFNTSNHPYWKHAVSIVEWKCDSLAEHESAPGTLTVFTILGAVCRRFVPLSDNMFGTVGFNDSGIVAISHYSWIIIPNFCRINGSFCSLIRWWLGWIAWIARYLLLCRYLTWHFEEVVAMAGAICEVVRPEEQQLWECRWTWGAVGDPWGTSLQVGRFQTSWGYPNSWMVSTEKSDEHGWWLGVPPWLWKPPCIWLVLFCLAYVLFDVELMIHTLREMDGMDDATCGWWNWVVGPTTRMTLIHYRMSLFFGGPIECHGGFIVEDGVVVFFL